MTPLVLASGVPRAAARSLQAAVVLHSLLLLLLKLVQIKTKRKRKKRMRWTATKSEMILTTRLPAWPLTTMAVGDFHQLMMTTLRQATMRAKMSPQRCRRGDCDISSPFHRQFLLVAASSTALRIAFKGQLQITKSILLCRCAISLLPSLCDRSDGGCGAVDKKGGSEGWESGAVL